jgi:aminoglycoside 6-adenylyltransferase
MNHTGVRSTGSRRHARRNRSVLDGVLTTPAYGRDGESPLRPLAIRTYDAPMDHRRVLDEVVAWATDEENVRLVVLTGSLARDDGRSHPLSDLDIELYVRDPNVLLGRRDWYAPFGEVLVVEELGNPGWHPTRLVYYVDGKIDFMIGPVAAVEAGGRYDRAFRVLVDKDGLGEGLRVEAEPNAPPDADAFARCVNWFWAAALMEAKAIVRDEPWMTMIRDRDLKDELLRMIEWDHRARYGWTYDTWHLGVRMREWMDLDVQDSLAARTAGSAVEEAGPALLASMELFDRLARRTAAALAVAPFDARPVRAEIDRILRMLRA